MHASVGMDSIDACPQSGHVKSEVVSTAAGVMAESLWMNSCAGARGRAPQWSV